MTSPLPGDVDMQFDHSVKAAMERLEAESHDQRVYPRQPFNDKGDIWLLDVLPTYFRNPSRTLWQMDRAMERYFTSHPLEHADMIVTIMACCMLVSIEVLMKGGL